PGLPHESAHARDSRVALLRPPRLAVALGIDAHAAELDHIEEAAPQADAALAIEDRSLPALLQLDQKRNQQHERQREDHRSQAHGQIERPGSDEPHGIAPESLAEDEPARVENVDAHASGLALEEREQLGHFDTREATLEELRDRKAAAPVIHGDDHLDGAELLAQTHEAPARIEDPVESYRPLRSVGRDEANDDEAPPIRAAAKSANCSRRGPGTVDEHAALEEVLIDHVRKDHARDRDPAQPADRRERLESAPHPERRHEIEQGRRDDEADEERQGHARGHAGEPRALPQTVQPEGEETDHHDAAEEQRARPDRAGQLGQPGNRNGARTEPGHHGAVYGCEEYRGLDR